MHSTGRRKRNCAQKKGVDMIIMGNDVMFLNEGNRRAREAIDASAKA